MEEELSLLFVHLDPTAAACKMDVRGQIDTHFIQIYTVRVEYESFFRTESERDQQKNVMRYLEVKFSRIPWLHFLRIYLKTSVCHIQSGAV